MNQHDSVASYELFVSSSFEDRQDPDPKKIWTYMWKGKFPMRGVTMPLTADLPCGVIKLNDYHEVGVEHKVEAGFCTYFVWRCLCVRNSIVRMEVVLMCCMLSVFHLLVFPRQIERGDEIFEEGQRERTWDRALAVVGSHRELKEENKPEEPDPTSGKKRKLLKRESSAAPSTDFLATMGFARKNQVVQRSMLGIKANGKN